MSGAAISPIAFAQGEGEVFWSFGGLVTVKATAETTGGGVEVIEILAPAGAGSPLHVHHREDEWFYVIEGELTFWVGGQTIHAPPARSSLVLVIFPTPSWSSQSFRGSCW
jgi:quercetin dioxygenase-like cupin family protein